MILLSLAYRCVAFSEPCSRFCAIPPIPLYDGFMICHGRSLPLEGIPDVETALEVYLRRYIEGHMSNSLTVPVTNVLTAPELLVLHRERWIYNSTGTGRIICLGVENTGMSLDFDELLATPVNVKGSRPYQVRRVETSNFATGLTKR